MRCKMLVRAGVEAAFVSVQTALAGDVIGCDLLHSDLVRDRHMERADVAAALDQDAARPSPSTQATILVMPALVAGIHVF
jgi:hypothetical protein